MIYRIWNLIKRGFLWLYVWFHSIILRFSIALYNTEEEVLKSNVSDLDEKKKFNQRIRHKNPIIEKMLMGRKDEQFAQDYYEILKKSDKFLRESTPEKIEMAAGKWGINYGKTNEEMQNVGKVAKKVKRNDEGKIIKTNNKSNSNKNKKDKFGRRYEHFGFFDPKNKNYGKTLSQVMREEITQRITTDEKHPIEFMFSNKPLEQGIGETDDIIETKTDKSKTGFEAKSELQKALERKYPMIVVRDSEVSNKIEQLTEFLHIKKVNSIHRILEFFIPAKYKTFDFSNKSDIFAEIINVKQIWIKDEYGGLYGYSIDNFHKRLIQNIIVTENDKKVEKPIYEVIKLNGKVIEKI